MSVTSTGDRRSGERRRAHERRWPERRSGFDRRTPRGPLRGGYERALRWLHDNPRSLFLMLAIVTVLNLADLLLTQRALVLGASEVNPLMRYLFDLHPVWAALVKASVGMIAVEVMWAMRGYRAALVLSMAAATGMAVLFLYHLASLQIAPI